MKFVNPWMLVLVALVPVAGAWWVFLRARAEKRLNGLVAPALQGGEGSELIDTVKLIQ